MLTYPAVIIPQIAQPFFHDSCSHYSTICLAVVLHFLPISFHNFSCHYSTICTVVLRTFQQSLFHNLSDRCSAFSASIIPQFQLPLFHNLYNRFTDIPAVIISTICPAVIPQFLPCLFYDSRPVYSTNFLRLHSTIFTACAPHPHPLLGIHP